MSIYQNLDKQKQRYLRYLNNYTYSQVNNIRKFFLEKCRKLFTLPQVFGLNSIIEKQSVTTYTSKNVFNSCFSLQLKIQPFSLSISIKKFH